MCDSILNDKRQDEDEMSDYIFKRYEEYRDKFEAATKELALLRQSKGCVEQSYMTDYQFKYIMDLKDENAKLHRQLELLCQASSDGETPLTDLQFTYLLELQEKNKTLVQELEQLKAEQNRLKLQLENKE